jgi:[acyl-carrier-protein] S-malonyltransferase
VLKANKKNIRKKCKDFYGYLRKTLHFGNNIHIYPVDFKVFSYFSANPMYCKKGRDQADEISKMSDMKAYVFPGQGAQYPGMGKALYENHEIGKELFEQANEMLEFRITELMFEGPEEDLKQTKVTQPAIFLHSVILAKTLKSFQPDMVAGHSLGEFSALVANGCLSFEDGLRLVSKRAEAMQKACEANPSTMAAIMGLDDETVEQVCQDIDEILVPANYNSPGQVVISGSIKGVDQAVAAFQEKGAKRAVKLKVGGAFHSPLMEPAKKELEKAIHETTFNKPVCQIYQNATASPSDKPDFIKENLIKQLTSPVKWTQTIKHMIADGAESFTEVGPGKVLQGLIKKVDRKIPVQNA